MLRSQAPIAPLRQHANTKTRNAFNISQANHKGRRYDAQKTLMPEKHGFFGTLAPEAYSIR